MEQSIKEQENLNIKMYVATSWDELDRLEMQWRNKTFFEHLPFAMNTPFREIAEKIIPDRKEEWASPILYAISRHGSNISSRDLLRKAEEWYKTEEGKKGLDILSMASGMEENMLMLKVLMRVNSDFPDFKAFFSFIGEDIVYHEIIAGPSSGHLVIPDEIKDFSYSESQIKEHEAAWEEQKKYLESATKEMPFLNQIDSYVPEELWKPEDTIPLLYDLKGKEMDLKTLTPYETFTKIFNEIMRYVSGVEYYHYVTVMKGDENEEEFLKFLRNMIEDDYITNQKNGLHLFSEDLPAMMDKVNNALFKMYVVQDLIDDPLVTDIKITNPHSIRARIKGKAYKSNIVFVDDDDYKRFIKGICLRNNISQNVPTQTFTDSKDENYILRFSLMAPYVMSNDLPCMHIRKVSRRKMMGDDLIQAGMMTPKVRDYLLECGKKSRGVVFAGPPGSGKTVALNWFLEAAYEQSAEILVIQENDELFSDRDGIMFEHVVHYSYHGNEAVSLEQLGQLALVAGANVFIIGEAKGAEICSAITLSNSGCRTAITIHSPSSTETVDKMADLAMRGYAQDYVQAKRMLKSFQTIVYLQDFCIQEISEIKGFNEETQDMEYDYIYRKGVGKE